MEVNTINIIITVKNIPNMIFNHLFIWGFNVIDKKTIKAGIANKTDAKNNFSGLSSIFSPLISPAIFFGTYSSK